MSPAHHRTKRPRRGIVGAVAGPVAAVVLAGLLSVVATGPASADVPACPAEGITVTSLNAPVFYIDSTGGPQLHVGYAGYQVTSATARRHLYVKVDDFTGEVEPLGDSAEDYTPLGAVDAGGHASAFFALTARAASGSVQTHTVSVYAGLESSPLCTTTGSFEGVEETSPAEDNQLGAWHGGTDPAVTVSGVAQLGGTLTVTVEGNTGAIGGGTATDPGGFTMTPSALGDFPARTFRLVGTSLLISPDGTSPERTYDDVLHVALTGADARDYRARYTFVAIAPIDTTTPLLPVQQIASGSEIRHTDTSDLASLPTLPTIGNPLSVDFAADPAQLDASGGTASITETFASSSVAESSLDLLYTLVPPGASFVPGSATVGGSPVDDPAVVDGVLLFYGPFVASSAAPVAVSFDISLVPSNRVYSILGLGLLVPNGVVGSTRSGQLTLARTTVTVGTPPVPQTITFPPPADVYVDRPRPELAATADSGLPVAYTSATPAVCTVADAVVTPVAVGTCTITASQPGDETHDPAVAVSQSFDVLAEPQSITAPAAPDVPLDGAPATLTATASSGLPVTWTTSTPQTCVVEGGRPRLVATGTCTLVGSQPGDTTYAPAPSATVTFQVLPPAVPLPTGASGSTVGTAPGHITVPGLPTGTVLTIDPDDLAAVPGLSTATVSGASVELVADPDFSGVLTLPVTATRASVSSRITLTLVVSPPAVGRASARPVTAARSRVAWQPSSGARRYEVTLRGRVLCVTDGLRCTVPQLLGPASRPRVVALGGAGTRSVATVAVPRLRGRVVLARVFFPAPATHLTRADRRALRAAAHAVLRSGFRHVLVVGRTHDQVVQVVNARLARLRAVAAATYLRRLVGPHGVEVAVGARGRRHFGGTAARRALERRTDVYLS